MPGTWTTMGTKTAGQVVGASTDWNPLVGNVAWLGGDRPDVKAYRGSAQSIPSTTETLVLFDTDLWDPWNMHNTGSQTSRFVCPVAGKYRFGTSIRIDSAACDFYIQLRLNGSPFQSGLDTRVAGRANST